MQLLVSISNEKLVHVYLILMHIMLFTLYSHTCHIILQLKQGTKRMTISPFNRCIYISFPPFIFLLNFENAKFTIKYPRGVTTTFMHLTFHTYIKRGGIRNILKLSALLKMGAKNQSEFRRVNYYINLEQNEGCSLISVTYLFGIFPPL